MHLKIVNFQSFVGFARYRLDAGAPPRERPVIILGLPKEPLKDIVAESPDIQSPQLESNLEKVEAIPMTKLFAVYDEPWWTDDKIEEGRSITDLPLGQVYYHGNSEQKDPFIRFTLMVRTATTGRVFRRRAGVLETDAGRNAKGC